MQAGRVGQAFAVLADQDKVFGAAAARRASSASRRVATSSQRPSARSRAAASAAAPIPAMPTRFSVPERRPISWPPPVIQGLTSSPCRTISAPTPFGPPNLCAETSARSAPVQPNADRHLADRLHQIQQQPAGAAAAGQRPQPVDFPGRRRDQPGLVIRVAHRQRLARPRAPIVDMAPKAVMRGRLDPDPVAVGALRQHHRRLGRARGEHHLARLAADRRRDLAPRPLDQRPRRPALGMDRGRVADQIAIAAAIAARASGPQRRGRVPVEIDPAAHHRRPCILCLLKYSRRRLPPAPPAPRPPSASPSRLGEEGQDTGVYQLPHVASSTT